MLTTKLINILKLVNSFYTDAPHKNVKESLEEASFTKKMFTNKLKSLVTNQNEELEMKNLRQLNNKLTRILEEEFTKNKSLKQVHI